jgi:hypothetical protein
MKNSLDYCPNKLLLVVQIKASHCLFIKEIYTVWQAMSKMEYRKKLIGYLWVATIREGDWEKFGMGEK